MRDVRNLRKLSRPCYVTPTRQINRS
jgi:hypothetical protein